MNWKVAFRPIGLSRTDTFVSDLERLPAEEAKIWKKKLKVLENDCGCKAGAVTLIASMAIYIYYFLFTHTEMYSVQQKILAGCVIFFVSAVIGKTFGLFLASYRYKVLRKKLAVRLGDHSYLG